MTFRMILLFSPLLLLLGCSSTLNESSVDNLSGTTENEVILVTGANELHDSGEENAQTIKFPIPELGISLVVPSSVGPYLAYEFDGQKTARLYFTNYRNKINPSDIPTLQEKNEKLKNDGPNGAGKIIQMSEQEYKQQLEYAKKCDFAYLGVDSEINGDVFGSYVLAKNINKRVLYTTPHDPCNFYRFFDGYLDSSVFDHESNDVKTTNSTRKIQDIISSLSFDINKYRGVGDGTQQDILCNEKCVEIQ